MAEAGGHRIKRSINIDTTRIRFLNDHNLAEMKRAPLLTPYLSGNSEEVAAWNSKPGGDLSTPLNGRRMINIGTFRA